MLRTVLLPFVRRCSHARALSTAAVRSCTGEGKEKLVIFDTTLRDGGGCFPATPLPLSCARPSWIRPFLCHAHLPDASEVSCGGVHTPGCATPFAAACFNAEQSPGATLNTPEKLAIARQLSRLGVDVCEAGFPIASPGAPAYHCTPYGVWLHMELSRRRWLACLLTMRNGGR